MMPRKKPDVKFVDAETRLPERVFEQLADLARQNERSIAAELRVAVRRHLRVAA